MHPGRIIIDHSNEREKRASKIERWRAGVNAALLDSEFTRSQSEVLRWSVEAHHFNIFICGKLTSTAQMLGNLSSKYDNLNDHFILMILLTGGIEIKIGHYASVLDPGDLIILDILQPMKMKLLESNKTKSIEVIYVAIPRLFLYDAEDGCHLHGKVLEHRDILNRLITSQILSLIDSSPGLSIDDVNRVARPVMEFLVHAIKSSCSQWQPLANDVSEQVLSRVCDFIYANLRLPLLTPELIGKNFGLSRSSLYRLFESYGGIVAHIRRKRITAATRMLLHPQYRHWQVAEIAYYWQFEPATFNRLFAAIYDTTPNLARKEQQKLWALDSVNESQVLWLKSL
ncbi:AraC family transcriptional regulator [Biostraticola tofi]|uniref:AraC family transcriptional regulator n=1 Tax=Biostraticola tofi TaxID=466109 RepID=A0A4R3Z2U1_9GAMM|nr:AraC family transcriptional regulator [Biostraticola tofi]TCV98204.1 AraC family transcriptional regulator [Biostraticola tofi]